MSSNMEFYCYSLKDNVRFRIELDVGNNAGQTLDLKESSFQVADVEISCSDLMKEKSVIFRDL
jgi:hypothetical protein